MSFDPIELLRKSTSRAKSDVANKLVSMLLHELSRRVNQVTRLTVNGATYSKLASDYFGNLCLYCSRELKSKHVAVEHLDGMNRFRAGLHIPGNVLISCSDCNREKRRDDQLPLLVLASTGWESFLSHDSTRCQSGCKSCHYWRQLMPIREIRSAHLSKAANRIREFRGIPQVHASLKASKSIQKLAAPMLQKFYRESQDYAQSSISSLADSVWKPAEF